MNNVKLLGKFKIDSLVNGIIVPKVPWQENLIVTSGINRLSTGGITKCFIGTGDSIPVLSDTSLNAQIASTDITQQAVVSFTESPWGSSTPFIATFSPTGSNNLIAEIGLGWDTGLFSRALIKDMLGNPQKIMWASDETLILTYSIIVKPILTDFTYTLTMAGIPYEITSRACYASDSLYWRFYNDAQEFQKIGDGSAADSVIYFGLPGAGTNVSAPSGVVSANLQLATSFNNVGYKTAKFVADKTINNNGNSISALLIASTIGTIQYSFNPFCPKYSDDIFEFIVTTPLWG